MLPDFVLLLSAILVAAFVVIQLGKTRRGGVIPLVAGIGAAGFSYSRYSQFSGLVGQLRGTFDTHVTYLEYFWLGSMLLWMVVAGWGVARVLSSVRSLREHVKAVTPPAAADEDVVNNDSVPEMDASGLVEDVIVEKIGDSRSGLALSSSEPGHLDEMQTSAATAIAGGTAAGLVVCLSCLLPLRLAGVGLGERAWDFLPSWQFFMPPLWAAVSAGGGSFCFGSSAWTALRAALLGFFGWPLALTGIALFSAIAQAVGIRWNPGPWQWWILSACMAVPGGASLGVVVARRALSEGIHDTLSEEIENEPRGRYDWEKVATRCGMVGLLLILIISSVSIGPEGSGAVELAVFVILPAILLSTVAVVVGLWTRSSQAWILGLLAFACLFLQRYLRGG